MPADNELLQDDERARRDVLDVERSFIVQAPAGSGKTELLIQRYLRLLATVDNPEEVLAITFTRKAAAEMQLRVLRALQNAESGEEPAEDHEQITAEAAKSVLAMDKRLQWNLVANPRRMRIQTLDSLNSAIAGTQPLTSTGGAAGTRILADAEMKALYRSAATLTLDQLVETGPLHEATEQVLLHVDNNTSLYIAYLAAMLQTRDQWLPFVGSGLGNEDEARTLRQRFERSIGKVVTNQLRETHTAFPAESISQLLGLATYAILELEQAGNGDNPVCALLDIGGVPASDANAMPQWLGLAEFLLTKDGRWRKTVNKNQGFPPGDDGQKAAMLELLDSLRDRETCRSLLQAARVLPPVRYSDDQWLVLLALFRLLPLAVTELKRLFSERGVTDYIEVALSAGDALGTAEDPGEVALLLDYQLRHLLVDEMQDTSSAQYRMLEALTGGWEDGDGRTLFCVGDPMQSIYRFRNAEVGQFLLARRTGIGAIELNSLILRRNFRSGEVLVDWFNRVFPTVLPARDDPSQSAVSYSAAVPVPKFAGQGKCVVYPLFGSNKAMEADTGCQIISDTLRQNPDQDMAVLVRGRNQLPQLLARLRRVGIAYRAVEIDRLTDLPEIIDILALTRALIHLGDRLAWLAVLRSPWIGLDWTDLHALVRDAKHSVVWDLLNDDDRVATLSDWGRQAVLSARDKLATALQSDLAATLRDRVERAWLSLGGPALLADSHAVENIYRYLDVLDKLDVAGSLPDVAELESILDLERVSGDSKARLQIMTMHRAKGLQFDHVLLFGLGRVPGKSERSVLSWFDIPNEHGGEEKIISPVGPRTDLENDPLHRYIELTESARDRHEHGRLLYVACTRARRSLHLLGHVDMNRDRTEFRPASSRSLLSLLWPAVSGVFDSALDVDKLPPEDGDGDGWVQPVLRRFRSSWSTPSVPALPGEPGAADAIANDRAVEFYWVGAAARFAGTVVHRWLQKIADGQVQLQIDELPSLRPASVRWLREMGVSEDLAPVICDRVDAALLGTLRDGRGRWILEGNGHAELGLSGMFKGRMESVVLDRVRIDDDGTHWIVDYKTSSHEGGSLNSFLKAEVDRYRPQLEKYAALYRNYSAADVRCALYFPVLQEFVEIAEQEKANRNPGPG